MRVEITMPKLSDTMEEGTVIRWRVRVGDRVSRGDVIAEVETDKAAMEMEAFEEGTVTEIRASEGETVPVGTVIAVLNSTLPETAAKEKAVAATVGPAGELLPEAAEKSGKDERQTVAEQRSHPAQREEPADRPADARIVASPAARKLAEEKGIPLSAVTGTGPGGRIVLADVEKRLRAGDMAGTEKTRKIQEGPTGPPGTASKAARVREVIARKMEESWKNIPHFYVTVGVDVSEVVRFHRELKVSLNDFVLAAVGRALRNHPQVNSFWADGKIVPQADVNVAFAVSTDRGLYSPVLKHCDRLSLQAIHIQSRQLREKVMEEKLRVEDLEGATFTVSNMGMLGVESFSALITPPQGAALAVGAAAKEVVVADNGNLEVVHRMRLTLSADHRILDGADGAAFLGSVKKYLEAPLQLVVTVE